MSQTERNRVVENHPSRLKHYCGSRGIYVLDGRWMDVSGEFTASCPGCQTRLYWDESGTHD